MTKIVNRMALASGAVFLILCGLFPKLAALISIMPQSVLGGAAVMMFSLHRDQRNPAYYQRTDDDAQYHDRLRRIGTWLWNRIQQRHPCTSAAGHPADLWRFRYCSGSHCCDHL